MVKQVWRILSPTYTHTYTWASWRRSPEEDLPRQKEKQLQSLYGGTNLREFEIPILISDKTDFKTIPNGSIKVKLLNRGSLSMLRFRHIFKYPSAPS